MDEKLFAETSDEMDLKVLADFRWSGRENLGGGVPIVVYRLFQYSLKNILIRVYGKDRAIDLFRRAGYEAGAHFAASVMDLTLPMSKFIASLQETMIQYKIGILRVENQDKETGRIVLTVAEDADCSGLPVMGETVCNYDEGFLSGVLTVYTGQPYEVKEIDCWATGDRVCRFVADRKERRADAGPPAETKPPVDAGPPAGDERTDGDGRV